MFQFLLFVQYHRICIVIIIMQKIGCEYTVLYGMIQEGLFKEGLNSVPMNFLKNILSNLKIEEA